MSKRYPIISVTGSSGAGTSSIKRVFEQIFRRESINASFLEGDSYHRFNRFEMRELMAEQNKLGNKHFSHFGEENNLLKELETTFKTYGETGSGKLRYYIHDAAEAKLHNSTEGHFTEWSDMPSKSDVLFYEGLHGCAITPDVNCAQFADLKIGVVPVINLEWIQKLHRDKSQRGYSTEAVTDTILRRMPDYVKYIVPQFSETDINFQRVPTVDTSNPFIARWIPTPEESIVVIRFKNPRGIDFPYLLSMIEGSFMSRANSIVVPGGKMDLAMQLILTPLIMKITDEAKQLARRGS